MSEQELGDPQRIGGWRVVWQPREGEAQQRRPAVELALARRERGIAGEEGADRIEVMGRDGGVDAVAGDFWMAFEQA